MRLWKVPELLCLHAKALLRRHVVLSHRLALPRKPHDRNKRYHGPSNVLLIQIKQFFYDAETKNIIQELRRRSDLTRVDIRRCTVRTPIIYTPVDIKSWVG